MSLGPFVKSFYSPPAHCLAILVRTWFGQTWPAAERFFSHFRFFWVFFASKLGQKWTHWSVHCDSWVQTKYCAIYIKRVNAVKRQSVNIIEINTFDEKVWACVMGRLKRLTSFWPENPSKRTHKLILPNIDCASLFRQLVARCHTKC